MLMSTAAPVCGSMLTSTMESVRTPMRSSPASEPMSRRLTRLTPSQGSGACASGVAVCSTDGVRDPMAGPVNTVLTTSRWIRE